MDRKQSKSPVAGSDLSDALDNDRHFVTSLYRGLELLRCFQPGEKFLGNQEIAKRINLPKSTVSRLTNTLTKLGYLVYSESMGKYSLGTAVLSLGYAYLSYMDIRQVARPMMQKLADYAGASVAISARDRLDMVYIENCRSNSTVFTMRTTIGSHLPIAQTAVGRAYLCGIKEKERDHLMDLIRQHYEQDWPQLKAGIEQALLDYEERGFCMSLGDYMKDLNGVAVPYIPPDGSEVLSFNLGAPAFQLRRHMIEDDIGPHLIELVRSVTAEMYRHA
jgi:DNA-binding IclR family transcriptional regulator